MLMVKNLTRYKAATLPLHIRYIFAFSLSGASAGALLDRSDRSPAKYIERFWKVLCRPLPGAIRESVVNFGLNCSVLDFPCCSLGHFHHFGVILPQPFDVHIFSRVSSFKARGLE